MKNIVPEWFRKTSIYQINPRTFSAEGTIKAVTEQLPALAELGFGIMYLCPIFREDVSEDRTNWSKRQLASNTNNPKNPYRIDNYFEIDEEYGNMDDLREFVTEAHILGMRVILDLVYLHIGPNAEILKSHPEFAAKNEDGSIKLTRWNFPYINYESEGLKEYLWCNMTYFVSVIGVDGFRCDVGDAVPLDFWREGKRRVKAIDPESILINEGRKPEYLAVFDANYGFSWHCAVYDLLHKTINAEGFIKEYNALAEILCHGELILRDMDNHDTVTDWPYRIEGHFGSDCMELILVTNYFIDGVPMVYCGNELADTARLNMFANRFFMGEYEVTDRAATGEKVERRKALIKGLNSLKAERPILQCGKTEWISTEAEYVLAFNRTLDGEKVTFVGNFSEDAVELTFAQGTPMLSNGATLVDGKLKFEKYGYAVFA